MGLFDLFNGRSRKLIWHRLDDSHVIERDKKTFASEAIVKDEDYVVLRMNEMWLVESRKLWRKQYPMLHAFVKYGETALHDVVGPGQLSSLGDRNLDKMAAFNHLIAGPLPHRGFELCALVGLYAIPGEDGARALVEVVGNLAALTGAGALAGAVVGVVKDSVDKVLSLDGTKLQIGVENTWAANIPLRSGYYLGIDAAEGGLTLDSLWLDADRRLHVGRDPIQGKLFDSNDYMVLAVERHTTNPVWGTIPEVAAAEADIESIMKSSKSLDDKKAALNDAFPRFRSALAAAPSLTVKDGALIAVAVADKLVERLKAEAGIDFTKKSFASSPERIDVFEAAAEQRKVLDAEGVTLAAAEKLLRSRKF
jgi:hypothetical protein